VAHLGRKILMQDILCRNQRFNGPFVSKSATINVAYGSKFRDISRIIRSITNSQFYGKGFLTSKKRDRVGKDVNL
jgi:hypothetical protein